MRLANGRRNGMALGVAIFAIVIIGGIIAGTFFASTQEFRVGRNALTAERAMSAAEYGQNLTLTKWNRTVASSMKAGDTLFRVDTVSPGVIDTVRVTKLNPTTFWVVSTGRAGTGLELTARRRTGMLVTLNIPYLKVPAALTTRGADTIGGNEVTNGYDTSPNNWDCPPLGVPVAGVATPDSNITYKGTNYTVQGSPAVQKTSTAGDTSSFFNLGGTSYDTLAASANKVFAVATGSSLSLDHIQESTIGGACNTADQKNWGDIGRAATPKPCESYFPIVRSQGGGTMKLSNGVGQGMLLVDGNLEISGDFQFNGLILVKGRIRITGTGNKLYGGVLAANTNGSANYISGSAQIYFSRCALMTSLASSAWPKMTRERSWADTF